VLATLDSVKTALQKIDAEVKLYRDKLRQFGKIMEYIGKNPYVYNLEEIDRLVPTLLKSYLKGAARICGEPALDREFHCIDFLIVMKIEEMSAMMKGKYRA
jgi:hypothetical protein